MKDFISMSFFSSYAIQLWQPINCKWLHYYNFPCMRVANSCMFLRMTLSGIMYYQKLPLFECQESYVVFMLQYAATVSQRMNGERGQKTWETNWRRCSGCLSWTRCCRDYCEDPNFIQKFQFILTKATVGNERLVPLVNLNCHVIEHYHDDMILEVLNGNLHFQQKLTIGRYIIG